MNLLEKNSYVSVTGIGLVTPLGIGVEDSWRNLLSGINACKFDPMLDSMNIGVSISCRIPNSNLFEQILGKSLIRRIDPFIQMALIAVREAIKDSGVDIESYDPSRIGIIVGNSLGGTEMFSHELEELKIKKGIVSASTIPGSMMNMVAGQIAIDLGIKGRCFVVSTACASGTTALGIGKELIESNQCDLVIAGATESPITPIVVAGMNRLGALSRNSSCQEASRPFDVDRDGFVIAEGAGFTILERKKDAENRSARVYSYISGYGESTDAYHVTTPEPEGEGLYTAIQNCLKSANVNSDDIQHINAHGTSTTLNDLTESKVFNKVFRHQPAVTSTKGATGHTLAASGAIESIFTILSIYHSIIPHTLNLKNLDPMVNLDVVQKKPRSALIKHALKTSLGFGGHNAVLLFTKAH
ncbi:hypothetical protein B6D12_12735 [Gilliamella apicola]|uniref:beta-ketoacyl-[acyl-carrier-protein] synthase family protein n=1 Tax=Gilliamella apicola TaxID=1196095 RepID=UPI000A344D01|nr:beta-ketoacyl-[acyl-carrier-protein] synthase family protein [Gilliamella apicola]OTP87373.1 hypothetical protein B5S41_12320 [Gilliamella apicola]OTP92356.1 hypothetical protein B6D13_12845 [Gilliamella apicola]OTP98756.1 hypothetical protein B6D07_12785 [Gilliamella apicola]OTQ03870.1 hypothetical protein B6D12_12735 [Gilliamella apicola]OTQ26262.1 hypothetical protein B6D02_11935 [Gilliamella apicola]